MADPPSRVILDTNLWISYLISSKLIKIDLLLEKGAIRLIFSEESLGEFIEVASRPKFRKFFSEEDIIELLSLIGHFAELVEVQSEVNLCRDPKDNFLLALAKDSNADYLVGYFSHADPHFGDTDPTWRKRVLANKIT
ncbi:MAG: putative toxin-antitoxin system toxin component, PIN family [Saprospirales bacterium]|nr:putative toxin-antitoxin system toxin component, PIN family [Saprospirales bacterium]